MSEAGPTAALDRAQLAAIEAERAWIAQLLHDTLCQSQAGLRLLAKMLERQTAPTDPAAVQGWQELNAHFTKVAADLAGVMDAVRPPEISPADLPTALDELAESCAPEVGCSLSLRGDFLTLPPPLATGLYAIAGEILRGALRTGEPQMLGFALEREPEMIGWTIRGAPTHGIRWDQVDLQLRCLGGTSSREAGVVRIHCPLSHAE